MGAGMRHLKMTCSVLSNNRSSSPWRDSCQPGRGVAQFSFLSLRPHWWLRFYLTPAVFPAWPLLLCPQGKTTRVSQQFLLTRLKQRRVEFHLWAHCAIITGTDLWVTNLKQQINPPSLKIPFVHSTTSKLWFSAPWLLCSILLLNALIRKHVFATL